MDAEGAIAVNLRRRCMLRAIAATAAATAAAGAVCQRAVATPFTVLATAAVSPPAAPPLTSTPAGLPMHTRTIPATGEPLPVIGCGTYVGFDVAADLSARQRLAAVLAALREAGGSVLDSSPMYGRAEAVVGDLVTDAAARRDLFIATKVWIDGREAGMRQMEQSFTRLRTDVIDLMQVHNLVDWQTQIATLRDWKARGRVRYIGVTHYTSSAYRELEAVMRATALDFVQVNYAFDDRAAATRILPLAAERGIAVLINRPFGGGGGGGLLRRLRNRPLPGWAADIGATSWAQVLLKFVLSHPAVTCAIPGTGDPAHMRDNALAGTGARALPEPAFWDRHADDLALMS